MTTTGSLMLCLPGCWCFYYFVLLKPARREWAFTRDFMRKWVIHLVPQPAAVQSFTFFPIINIFFERSAMATAHVTMSHSLPTSQTLSWGGALAPIWRRAGDPTPSPHPAGGSLAASSPDRLGRHPAPQQEGSSFECKPMWTFSCSSETNRHHKLTSRDL